jgi:pimeloyl-[acyl-carrier protein] methyl ester esterase
VLGYPKNDKMTYTQLADYIELSLPTDRDFYLLAESFGGPLAIELAVRRPKQVKGIILSATFVESPIFGSWALSPLSNMLPIQLIPGFVWEYALMGHAHNPELKTHVAQTMTSVNTSVVHHRIKEVLHTKVSPRITQLDMPILYLQGQNDNLVLAHNYDRVKRYLPQTQKVVVPASHMVLQMNPEVCKAAISEFILRKEQHVSTSN